MAGTPANKKLEGLGLDAESIAALTESGLLGVLKRFTGDAAVQATLSELLQARTEFDQLVALEKAKVCTKGTLDTLALPSGIILDLTLSEASKVADPNYNGKMLERTLTFRSMGEGAMKLIGMHVDHSLKVPKEPFRIDDAIRLGTTTRYQNNHVAFDPTIRFFERVALQRGSSLTVLSATKGWGSRVELVLNELQINGSYINYGLGEPDADEE